MTCSTPARLLLLLSLRISIFSSVMCLFRLSHAVRHASAASVLAVVEPLSSSNNVILTRHRRHQGVAGSSITTKSLSFPNHPALLHSSKILQLRGGGGGGRRKKSVVKSTKRSIIKGSAATSTGNVKEESTKAENKKKQMVQVTLGSLALVSVSFITWQNRETLLRMFHKQKLQDSVLRILERIQDGGAYKGLGIYAVGMAVWEFLGMSTIPVETAAGMAFEYHQAFLASASGKLLGALLAFYTGRVWLSDWVERKLQDHVVMQLVENSVENHALRTAFLFKFSCFPEFVKNFGTSVLTPISPWMFCLATMVHGWPYSALWTFLGADTVARMQDENLPANKVLHALLIVAAMIGVVGSPALMAWWVRDLKRTSQANNADTRKRKKS